MATIIRMPEVLANATEAVIASWEVAEGAQVATGDLLAEIETEKAVVEYAAEEAGVVARLLAQPGETVAVGAPIALLLAHAGEEVDLAELLGEAAAEGPGGAAEEPQGQQDGGPDRPQAQEARVAEPSQGQESEATTGVPAPAAGGRIFASPLARKMAKERGIDLADLRGTGPGGRIVRRDVEAHRPSDRPEPTTPVTSAPTTPVTSAPATPPAGADVEEVPVTGMRRAIARRLTESKATVPHFYLSADCRVDELLALRRRINETGGTKVSVNDFVLKAVAAAFREVPEANVVWADTVLRRYRAVDVAVAVATDNGLVTPVVRGVDTMPLSRVSSTVAELATRARAGRLRQEELEGGSFTVSNLGMYGTKEFSAILNPPQSGILAVGAALQQPVVVDGELAVATVMRCTLSADHRAVDGALAAQWLAAFQRAVENPLLMLV